MKRLRLWLARCLLPPGYAIWTWGQYTVEGLDELVESKERVEVDLKGDDQFGV